MRRSGSGRGGGHDDGPHPRPRAVSPGRPHPPLRRRLGLEHSELRRPVDRVQRLLGLALLLIFLGAAPPLAMWAGSTSYAAGSRAEEAERRDRQRVTATVTTTGGTSTSGDRFVHETVQATWPGPDGEPLAGTLPSWRGVEVGDRRAIWVDRAGEPTVAPRPHSRTVTDAVYAGTAAILGTALPVAVAYGLVRRRCDRHRDALWDADWARLDAAGHGRRS
ncbi:Rv1733c family protein [Actinomadura algeriensis]|uniref:DUF3592 domain-containing protein n=1 Tax=Actinomadura algeriensis TaxID=1679523 RepID=A0ABR9JWY8_9ACTN|nr:hypothetical protein [Actinomadura algeriensis]MBE1535062.1 hypothetical protein [Actinomadura algeriensis]